MYQFALIGCGRIAQRHAEQINRVGRLVAVCDADALKAENLATTYAARWYASADDLLRAEPEVDVVVVCTPNGFHAEHIIKSLQSRRHVLCEKPMCLTTAAAWQIVETEKFTRRKLVVVKSARYNPLLQQLKSLISNNQLGRLYSFQLGCYWNRPPEYYTGWHGREFPDGGTLFTQFSHYIDAVAWLFGQPRSVVGYSANLAHPGVMEFEDTGVVSLAMENDMLGTINWSVNAYRKNCEITLTLLAEHGTISLDGEYLDQVHYQLPADLLHAKLPDDKQADDPGYKKSMSHHKEVYDSLVAYLEGGEYPVAGSLDGLQTVAFIEKIYKAVRQHGD